MRPPPRFPALVAIIAILAVVPGSAQTTAGPKYSYAMDVSTMSGMGMGMSMGAVMGGLFGGGGGDANYMLDLRLSSSVPAPQPEKGEHFFLPAAKMGKSLPLLGDVPGTPTPREYQPGGSYEKPKGRLLIFWGCNAHAPKGQPFILDFAKLPSAKMPPMAMPNAATMEKYAADAAARNENAAWWPNGKGGKGPKAGSSLIGEQRVTSNFTPEIKFALANDFMAALKVSYSDAAGTVRLAWNAVPTATGYAAWAMGGMDRGAQGGDMVMWTSANNRDFGEGMGWLAPAEVARQIAAKNVMPPSQTSCAIPAEAKAAAGGMMFGSMNAFGPEENFAYPPKPADPKAAWRLEWTAKARFRAFSSFLIGDAMGSGAGGGAGSGTAPAPATKPKPCKGPLGIPIPGSKC